MLDLGDTPMPLGPQNLDFMLTISRLPARSRLALTELPGTLSMAVVGALCVESIQAHPSPDGGLAVPPAVCSLPPMIHNGMTCDLGVLLWGFFDRFGNRFDYNRQAVSVRQGGITSKLKVLVEPQSAKPLCC